eukprot:CAMPEP_0202824380 /NCGR_PEP_ID=MMETSP1389-20130828/12313_1 /ASSEMBLY_ACC=CAM_ASM_000865 /TAXON_ID=302021 /ORGANISM="Rhodomonas sp., Strain CCMP768" /LENGTH=71 /DNA_ID=CAMNT_0049497465 /DNA_START=220 /DNA_END=431 /DNA_ORIENTATION=+
MASGASFGDLSEVAVMAVHCMADAREDRTELHPTCGATESRSRGEACVGQVGLGASRGLHVHSCGPDSGRG